ncbi:Retrovirus-related Pol polyprotein from transposon, partial [Zancudomyces culisetae]
MSNKERIEEKKSIKTPTNIDAYQSRMFNFNRWPEPEVFSGELSQEPEEWLKRTEAYFKRLGLEEIEYSDYVERYLEGKARSWYIVYNDSISAWSKFKEKFKARFYTKEHELIAWKKLQSYRQTDEGIMEVAQTLTTLFKKAKVTLETDKIKYFIMAVRLRYRRKLLESKSTSLYDLLDLALEEEQFEKVDAIGRPSRVSTNREWKDKSHYKTEDPKPPITNNKTEYDDLVNQFKKLSVNVLQVMKKLENSKDEDTYERNKEELMRNGSCFHCLKRGHRARDCRYRDSHDDEDYDSENEVKLDCIEVEKINKVDDYEVLAAEKRKIVDFNLDPFKRTKTVDEDIVMARITPRMATRSTNKTEPVAATNPGPNLREYKMVSKSEKKPTKNSKDTKVIKIPQLQRSKPLTKIAKYDKPYSIKNKLIESDAGITVSQLIQVSPEIRSEIIDLCKRSETAKEVNTTYLRNEVQDTTNCRARIKINGIDHWAVIDTGAACSVISPTLVESLDLPVCTEKDLVIITADGKKHSITGKVLGLPINIANNIFTVDALIMPNRKNEIILGTDWCKSHSVNIDLARNMLTLPIETNNIVLPFYTEQQVVECNRMDSSSEEEDSSDNEYKVWELYAIAKETISKTPKISNPDTESIINSNLEDYQHYELTKLVEKYNSIFVDDESELTQTNVIEHSIDTGDHKPIKQAPYRIPHRLKDLAKEEINKMLIKKAHELYSLEILRYNAIKNYLTSGLYPNNADEEFRRKLRNQARLYKLNNDKLYRNSLKYGLLEVLNEENEISKITEIHEEAHLGVSNTWEAVKKMYAGITHKTTTAYRPQSNGQVERLNGAIKNILAKICESDKDNWDCYLWKAMFAIRVTKNRNTNYSPAELLFGVELDMPNTWKPNGEVYDYEEAVLERIKLINDEIPELRNLGIQNSTKAKNLEKKFYDKTVRKFSFKIGNFVWLRISAIVNKFDAVWEGPYRITEVSNNGTYYITDKEGYTDIVHGDRLKLYHGATNMIPEIQSGNARST